MNPDGRDVCGPEDRFRATSRRCALGLRSRGRPTAGGPSEGWQRQAHPAAEGPGEGRNVTGRRPLVAINGLFLDHARSGTGVYTREVVGRLLAARDAPAPRFALLGHAEHAALVAGWGGRYVALEAPGRRRAAKLEKVLWEQAALPLAATRLRADLLYAPYFSLPLLTGARSVVTVHDLIPLLLPEYAPSAGFKAYFRLVSAAVKRAEAVVTDSVHAAGDIDRVLGVARDRIHVIYLGVDGRYRQGARQEQVESLRRRMGLPEQFSLYLGGVDPRKNVGTLLRAMRLLQQRRTMAMPLVVVAPRGGRWDDPRVEAARLGLGGSVLFLDWVEEGDKPALYVAARALVYPSRYEGFGLPPLEAMAAGTPVLCSNASSLPEVVGEAGLLLDPEDVEGWAEALRRVSEDDALCADLSRRGRGQAAAFTWEHTVAGLRSVFAQALER